MCLIKWLCPRCLQVNTDGLVLRGWYTSLTVAIYGTAERSHGHDQGSSPPPPPPPPQQSAGPKRTVKQGGCLPGETAPDSRFHTLQLKLKDLKRSPIPIYSDSIVIRKPLCFFFFRMGERWPVQWQPTQTGTQRTSHSTWTSTPRWWWRRTSSCDRF